MFKRILIFLICTVLILPIYNVAAENQISITAAFPSEQVTVNEQTQLEISVSGNVTRVKANLAYNNYFLNYSGKGLGFDINTGEYTITFTPGDEPYVLSCTAYNYGEAVLTLTNVIAETADGSVNLGDIKVYVTVTPQYTPIYTKQDLNNIRNDLSGNYILMNDIEFTAEDFSEGGAFYNDGFGWLPIGAVTKTPFAGEFNGNGHTISGLTINKAYYNYCGLFGVNRGVVTNLRIVDAHIDGIYGINMSSSNSSPEINGDIDYEDKDVWTEPDDSVTEESLNSYDRTGKSTANIGIICGFNLGSVKKCYASGEIYSNNSAGGITGRNSANISLCATNVKISGVSVAGGIIGIGGAYSKISDCVSESEITAAVSGGIAGKVSGAVSRTYSIVGANDKTACFGNVSNLISEEVYCFGSLNDDDFGTIKPMEELASLRFSTGEWTYTSVMPYPTPLADLVKITVTVLPGDLNGDGEINTVDLALMKLFLAGTETIDEKAGDLNGDESVDTSDLAKLKLNLAGME